MRRDVAIRDSRAAAIALSVLLASCVRASQMCDAANECASRSSCVAGRCVADGAVAAVTTARRELFDPVDVAYLRRGAGAGDPPVVASLGADDARLLFRFSIRLPPEANVVEAYLLLPRAPDVAADPVAVALHAARITEPWAVRSVSWARQPRIEDTGASVTRVLPNGAPFVRVDVGAVVRRWRRKDEGDFGVEILAEARAAALDVDLSGSRLELYVK